ncbi:hypothetical protein [Culturomica massiliensis]|uniref:hypothetical protein n=1 Tax=Culturomica massiliensis TaxID=1841857 RepID=UPI00235635B1|nr:hypothetical protein [Culturomica massiliensis]
MNKIIGCIGEFILAIMLIILMIVGDYDTFISGFQKNISSGRFGGMKQLLLIIHSSIGRKGVYSILIIMVIWLLYSSYKDRKKHRHK